MTSFAPNEDFGFPDHQASTDNHRKLFVGGLSYETTDESLALYFSQFGEIAPFQATVLRDPESSRSRGFGFVTFHSPQSAAMALRQSHHIIDGRKVECKLAVPRSRPNAATPCPTTSTMTWKSPPLLVPHSVATDLRTTSPPFFIRSFVHASTAAVDEDNNAVSSKKIFIGGLKYATSGEALKTFFESFFGEVESAQVIVNRDTKKSRGFGFVVFVHAHSVEQVLAHQSLAPLVVEGKQVEVKVCVPRILPPPQQQQHTPLVESRHSSSSSSPPVPLLPPLWNTTMTPMSSSDFDMRNLLELAHNQPTMPHFPRRLSVSPTPLMMDFVNSSPSSTPPLPLPSGKFTLDTSSLLSAFGGGPYSNNIW